MKLKSLLAGSLAALSLALPFNAAAIDHGTRLPAAEMRTLIQQEGETTGAIMYYEGYNDNNEQQQVPYFIVFDPNDQDSWHMIANNLSTGEWIVGSRGSHIRFYNPNTSSSLPRIDQTFYGQNGLNGFSREAALEHAHSRLKYQGITSGWYGDIVETQAERGFYPAIRALKFNEHGRVGGFLEVFVNPETKQFRVCNVLSSGATFYMGLGSNFQFTQTAAQTIVASTTPQTRQPN